MTALGTIALYAARSASVRMLLILFLRQQAIAAAAAVFAYILMAGTVKITSQKPASTLISLKVQLTE